MSGTILVATDGTGAAAGALRVAEEMAQWSEVGVQVLGVVEPVPVFDAGFMVALPEVELFEARREALRRDILAQLESVQGPGTPWPVSVEAGVAGSKIVGCAEAIGADAILMGLGQHRRMDRVFGTETVLQVLRLSHIPVLAVPQSVDRTPRSAAVGMDFSPFGDRAAEVTFGFVRPPSEVHLVHVLSGLEFLPTLSEEWRANYETELFDRLRNVARTLPAPAGSEVRPQILEGEPAQELLSFAEGKHIELLVAGSHGHSFVGRILMGSVSTRLIRGARCSVLVVPPTEQPEPATDGEGAGDRGWVKALADFTRANAGRPTTVELIDAEETTQVCGRGLPLLGVDYDPKEDRVNIMLGHWGTVEGHLSHSLPAPREIEVVTGPEGRGESVRIELRQGRVVLKADRG